MNPSEMVFVFGSNELGLHGGGAARAALLKHGAIWGLGEGYQNDVGEGPGSYAVPTCSRPCGEPNHSIPIEKVKAYIDAFIGFAEYHPEQKFQVTQIGCGLAGWTAEQIAPLFIEAPDNCYFDSAWEALLPGKKFWGTATNLQNRTF